MSDRNLRIQLVFDALDKLTGPLKSIGGQTDKTRKALSAAKKEVDALEIAQNQLAKHRDLTARAEKHASALAKQQAKTRELREEIGRLGVPTEKMHKQLQRATIIEERLQATHQRSATALQELSRKMREAGVDLNDLTGHEARLTQRAQAANRALSEQQQKLDALTAAKKRNEAFKSAGGKMTAMGAGALGAGVAMGAPLVMAAKDAITLESAVADIKKVMDFTPKGLQSINSDLLDMTTRIPMTVEGLAQISAAAARSGVGRDALNAGREDDARKELMAFTEDAARMGTAFDTTAEEAGETMSKWRVAFGLTQTETVKLGDQINALTDTFGGNVGAVADMVTRIGPLAKVAGVSSGGLAALSQVLNKTGVESEVGATGIKNMMLALTKGTAATKAQQTAFAKLGLSAQTVARSMQTDAEGTILDVMTRLSQLSPDAQASTLTQLFGSESVAAIAPMLTGLDQLKTNFAMVGDESQYAGSMLKEFQNKTGGTEGAVTLAVNSLKALDTQIGQGLTPAIKGIATFISPVASGFRKWAEANPALAGGITVFVAAAAGLVTLLGALGIAAGAATYAFGALGITTWATLWPVLAVIAAVAAIGGVIYLAVQHFDTLKKAAIAVWDNFLKFTGFGMIVRLIMPLFKAVAGGAKWIMDNWKAITAFFAAFWGALYAELLHPIRQGFTDLIAFVGGIWNDIKGPFSEGFDFFKDLFMKFTPAGWILTALTKLLDLLAEHKDKLKQVGGDMIQGLINGILDKMGPLGDIFRRAAKAGVAAFKDEAKIKSPSRVMMRLGEYMNEGLNLGLTRSQDAPISRMARISATITDQVSLGNTLARAPAAAGATGGTPLAAAPAIQIGSITIPITTSAGQSAQDIAQAVAAAFRDYMEALEARGRAAFADGRD